MYLSARETRLLSKAFGLLAEGLSAADVRKHLGYCLMELLQADFFASYVWNDSENKFDEGISINMDGPISVPMMRITSFMTPSLSSCSDAECRH